MTPQLCERIRPEDSGWHHNVIEHIQDLEALQNMLPVGHS